MFKFQSLEVSALTSVTCWYSAGKPVVVEELMRKSMEGLLGAHSFLAHPWAPWLELQLVAHAEETGKCVT